MCEVDWPVNPSPQIQLLLSVLFEHTGLIILRQMCCNRRGRAYLVNWLSAADPDCTEQQKTNSLLGKKHKQINTLSIPQHYFLLIHQPAEARELHIVSRWSLHCDVLTVPVIQHPVLLLFNLHQHNITQFLVNSHIVGIHLQILVIC